jgi:hypothetical protein
VKNQVGYSAIYGNVMMVSWNPRVVPHKGSLLRLG